MFAKVRRLPLLTAIAVTTLALGGCNGFGFGGATTPEAQLQDDSNGADWPGYGRTYGQQHYSPLHEVDQTTVHSLGLAWSMDLPLGNSATQPIAVRGVLYFATGLSVVHAVDAVSGKELWVYDPEVGKVAGLNLRTGWGVRGVAWWQGKVYVGTQDGRLIAIDAKTGKLAWSQQTYDPNMAAYISGAPRVLGGRVLIGYGGSNGVSRGYITAYDAVSGKQLWRFYTVPGDPSKGFENKAMEMAARTWSGEWWKYGGGGDVWNSIAYDPASDTVYFGVGSPYPWNHKLRSQGKGDNLFIDSIVAVDGKTGTYKWHYQTVPGDTWDFDATMDIELADLKIDGKHRKVLMQAPKNGFLYVIDRETGKLISAEPYVPVTWASKIDLATGRPVEMPGARYDQGKGVSLSPSPLAAHNWLPMAFSPKSGLVYIPAADFKVTFSEPSPSWKPATDRNTDAGANMIGGPLIGEKPPTGALIAWNPVTQKQAWRVDHPTYLNGGVLATAGDVVFQGTIDGTFKAYSARDGEQLWSFDTRAPMIAPPITYEAGGKQYVTVLTGLGMAYPKNLGALGGPGIERWGLDPRTQARRVLTFVIGGKGTLPPRPVAPPPPEDKTFKVEQARFLPGATAFNVHCGDCHGSMAVGSTQAPDLRRSPIPQDRASFVQIVRGGIEPAGMPKFPELDDGKLDDIRYYIRAQAAQLRGQAAAAPNRSAPSLIIK
ncbi:PQQ-dependent dehydrogenase, methanol/ethanol family [Novosphingobium sp. G106]|uniref:PQQ-dependent dehydrogenase, methanol/ethanol family n=1 Tax=Novosphingobium sp. G106 TaxID=2849500 RepID=UPI001C2DBFF7|nr:PQQ-dependent dehydrogenase, methanol/ethanol family [Novosphingobium sp. G106]MBV1688323.1 PQQ-dependent dehydrogenase, methanol/ethanol family [Novosphingobium sp. G106]